MRANMKICCSLSMASALLWSAQIASAQPQNDLDSAWALWSNLTGNMPSNYTFQYTDSTMEEDSNTPYVIDVRDDVVSRVYTLDVPAFDAPPFNTTGFPTITDLFTLIQDTITDDVPGTVYEYNNKYGYPEIIFYGTGTDAVNITVQALTPYTILDKELEKNMALWSSYGSATDSYSFVTQVSCFCTPQYVTPKFIVVEDNTIVSTVDLETMAPSDDTYDSITELFSRVQQSIENFYVTIDVTYNATFGFVTSINTNPEYLLMDAGSSIRVSNVTLADIASTTSPPSSGSDKETLPPTTPPTAAPIRHQWCFGFLKFNSRCRVSN